MYTLMQYTKPASPKEKIIWRHVAEGPRGKMGPLMGQLSNSAVSGNMGKPVFGLFLRNHCVSIATP